MSKNKREKARRKREQALEEADRRKRWAQIRRDRKTNAEGKAWRAAEKRRAKWLANVSAAERTGVTRFYPWTRAMYKTPNASAVRCPGYSWVAGNPNIEVTENQQHALAQLVRLHWYLRDALHDLKPWKLTTQMLMHRASGWRGLVQYHAGVLCITAPASPRPQVSLLVCAQCRPVSTGSTSYRYTDLRVYCTTCVAKHAHALTQSELIGPGPWVEARDIAATLAAPATRLAGRVLWQRVREGVAGRIDLLPSLQHATDALDLHLAKALERYVREYFMNINIPGPM